MNCTILESNSGPLDLLSHALPIELSGPLTYFFITLKTVAISKCLSDNRVINGKNRYFNC